MDNTNIAAKIASIEAQLRIIKASDGIKKTKTKGKGLRSIKGILKHKGNFNIDEIESAKIRYK